MKKQQKEQIKKDGECAKAIFQTFMSSPRWLTSLPKDQVDRMIGVMEEVFYMYSNLQDIHGENYDRYANLKKKFNYTDDQYLILDKKSINSLNASVEANRKLTAAYYLLELLRQCKNNPLPDLTAYCRNN